ncbi:hypothetical protein [Mariniblastus fucicola]|uniref:RedB protein n=1 Tax=Mariniblastus fucicola TaxID=980251 RepID=A0A5B9P3M5_9BACT|nr:hypothetical protein [Mariniblastus fucicola]QEG20794.1 hypothetical protein MFFC18_06450 [Mariniblastus fucicola]
MFPKKIFKNLLLTGLLTVSLAGFAVLVDYSSRPGPVAPTPRQFPAQAFPDREKGTPTIVVAYHPKCPCTFATVRCLERLRTEFRCKPNLIAYAYRPESAPDSWIESSSTAILRKFEGTVIDPDAEASVSRQFGARVSGHVFVYDGNDKLVFSGGITPGRGHEGYCEASLQFVRSVNGATTESTQWPIFGCEINRVAEESDHE